MELLKDLPTYSFTCIFLHIHYLGISTAYIIRGMPLGSQTAIQIQNRLINSSCDTCSTAKIENCTEFHGGIFTSNGRI